MISQDIWSVGSTTTLKTGLCCDNYTVTGTSQEYNRQSTYQSPLFSLLSSLFSLLFPLISPLFPLLFSLSSHCSTLGTALEFSYSKAPTSMNSSPELIEVTKLTTVSSWVTVSTLHHSKCCHNQNKFSCQWILHCSDHRLINCINPSSPNWISMYIRHQSIPCQVRSQRLSQNCTW